MLANWPLPIRTIGTRLKEHSFSNDERSGFILERVRDDLIEARYVERYEFKETVSDPFGKLMTFDRLEYRQTSFRASPNWPGLELIDAPRSSQGLVSELLEATNFTLSIAPLTVELLKWADAFQQSLGRAIIIDSIQLGSLYVEDGVKAKVVLKGDKDVRAACKELVNGKTHILEKLNCRVVNGQSRVSVLMANNAAIKIEGNSSHDDILQALRSSLPKSPT
jgi:hypothetical protein